MNTNLQVHHVNGSPLLIESGKPTELLHPETHESIFSSESLEECVLVSHLTQEIRSVLSRVGDADAVANLLSETVSQSMEKRVATEQISDEPVVSQAEVIEAAPAVTVVEASPGPVADVPVSRPAIKD